MTQLSMQKVFPGDITKAYEARLKQFAASGVVSGILERNVSVFRKKGGAHQDIIKNRLGWTDVGRRMMPEVPRMEALVNRAREAGIKHLFVLGMGGSSLCPEVLGRIFGRQSWLKTYTIVDTTAPSQLAAVLQDTELTESFFIVSSKSGTTIETLAQFRFFFRLMKDVRPLKVGNFFAAVTDEGSELHRMARRNRFVEAFLNPADIGGRYSALSYFGLVPGAFTKANVSGLLSGADSLLSTLESSPGDNDALTLGTLIGCAALAGRDKLRFNATGKMAPFIPWIEQLVAESTGKEGKGIVPIEGETVGVGNDFNGDGVFVDYSMGAPKPAGRMSGKSVPQVSIHLSGPAALGAEILKWEMATAVASIALGVNPFDEPNVAESKKNTATILKAKRGPRKEISVDPIAADDLVDIVSAEGVKGMERRTDVPAGEILSAFLSGVAKGDYVSLLCYTEMTPVIETRLARIRQVLGQKFRVVTLRGYGPRFLHSVGQLYKGGAQKGHFIVFQREYETDYEIPNMHISFARLIKAQAMGDIKALRKRKRPVLHINLKQDPIAGLERFLDLIPS